MTIVGEAGLFRAALGGMFMPVFKYIAVTGDGDQVKGTVEGVSLISVENDLLRQNLDVQRIKEKRSFSEIQVSPERVPRTEVMHFSRQVAAFVRTGIPIIDAGLTKGRVQQAESRLRQAELGAEQKALDIEGEVRDAWVAWEEGSMILDSSHKVVEQAEEALRLARASFEAGAATQLDVLQSQLELTRARLEEATALHTYHTALAGLRRAMGDIIDAKP